MMNPVRTWVLLSAFFSSLMYGHSFPCNEVTGCNGNYTFPDDFIFSAASAAYQIEGGWNEDGKGLNIWDSYLHANPSFIKDMSNGDIACDSYHKYKEDVQMLKEVGFNAYRFSIAWTRIIPDGDVTNVNQAGIDYYNNLINELLANNIQPMVTLYHWDMPQRLQELGGWMNPLLIDYFEDYARIVFNSFGDRVRLWITINEPQEVSKSYGSDAYAPAINMAGIGEYVASHNLIKAHARIYRMYQNEFKDTQGGKLSLSISGGFCRGLTNSTEDAEAADRWNQFTFGWYAHPIYSEEGDYPSIMREVIDQKSADEGRNWSRLPVFTPEEIEEIRGTYDFYGMNYYSGMYCSKGNGPSYPAWWSDTNVQLTVDPNWPGSASDWLKVDPEGFGLMLRWVNKEYNNPPVFITENGFSDFNTLDDQGRISYYQGYITEMAKAMYDGCNVIGHTSWSIMDNFEWRSGYTQDFGLYHVDFSSPNRTRTPKASVGFFQNLIRTRTI